VLTFWQLQELGHVILSTTPFLVGHLRRIFQYIFLIEYSPVSMLLIPFLSPAIYPLIGT
jgi:hypothetical protein